MGRALRNRPGISVRTLGTAVCSTDTASSVGLKMSTGPNRGTRSSVNHGGVSPMTPAPIIRAGFDSSTRRSTTSPRASMRAWRSRTSRSPIGSDLESTRR